MSYCSSQDLVDRFGEAELIQLTDHERVGGIDSAVLDRAISDADGEIDGYLSKFPRPISPVPKVLMRIACDITRYYLYDDQATEHVQRRYDNAVAFLKGVARGEISIGVDEAGESPQSDNEAVMESGGNVFNRSDNGFI